MSVPDKAKEEIAKAFCRTHGFEGTEPGQQDQTKLLWQEVATNHEADIQRLWSELRSLQTRGLA